MTMAEYHVGCGAFAIYAGTLNSRNKNLWQNKSEVTDEATAAVAQYLLEHDESMFFEYKGVVAKKPALPQLRGEDG